MFYSEVWRTSTPEPIKGDGIVWTQLKDVTRYIPLFAKSGTFILELDNVVTTGLDGLYASKFLPHFVRFGYLLKLAFESNSYTTCDCLCLIN